MASHEAYLWRPWINHSRDVVTGLTVTVPASTGVLIVAALAVLVRMAGSAAWTIVSYALHQARTSAQEKDVLHKIGQVQLRNAGTPAGSAWEIIKSGYSCSGEVRRPMFRAYGLAIWPLVINAAFVVASIFVAKVTVASHRENSILLRRGNCGFEGIGYSRAGGEVRAMDPQWTAKHTNDTRQSRAYVDNCYDSPDGTFGCSQLPEQRLPFNSTTDAPCPFGDLCRELRSSAVQFDTGELSSHTHLGINAKQSDRLGFRMLTTCDVLSIKDKYLNVTTDPGTNFGTTRSVEVKLGPIGDPREPVVNYTLFYNTVQSITIGAYQISDFFRPAGNFSGNLGWHPVPALDVADGDISLLIIMPNNILYRAPSFDPLFSANGTWTFDGAAENETWIQPDAYINSITCIDQLQFCNPSTATCGPLLGTFQTMQHNLFALGLNDVQIVTAWRIVFAHFNSHIADSAGNLGPASLAANEMVIDKIFSPGLPDDQWIRESTRWFKTSLANVQQRVVDYPNNPWSVHLADQWQSTGIEFGVMPPQGLSAEPPGRVAALEHQCGSQMVRSTNEYQSFVVVGIIIVVVFSCAIIVISWTLPWCVSKRKDRRPGGKNRYRLEAYDADSNASMARALMHRSGQMHAPSSDEEIQAKGVRTTVEERGSLLSPAPPRYTSASV